MGSSLNMFLWAMATFPEAQTAAHSALDRMLQRKRLPEIEDRDAVPYLTALLYEVMRLVIVVTHLSITTDCLPAGVQSYLSVRVNNIARPAYVNQTLIACDRGPSPDHRGELL